MRRPFLVSLLLALVVVAAGATMRAPSLAGTWTATYSQHPLVLKLKGSGSHYSGTYTVISYVNGKKPLSSTVPASASLKVVKQITTVTLTLPKTHTTIPCALVKGKLICVALNQTAITFTHSR